MLLKELMWYTYCTTTSLRKSPACVLMLKLGQHRHRVLTQSHVTLLAGRVYTVLMFKGSDHRTLFLY